MWPRCSPLCGNGFFYHRSCFEGSNVIGFPVVHIVMIFPGLTECQRKRKELETGVSCLEHLNLGARKMVRTVVYSVLVLPASVGALPQMAPSTSGLGREYLVNLNAMTAKVG